MAQFYVVFRESKNSRRQEEKFTVAGTVGYGNVRDQRMKKCTWGNRRDTY
jgi:hypothetical protein